MDTQLAGSQAALLSLATGFMATRAIYAATLLGFFDCLSEIPTSADAIARLTAADPGAALRLLRALAALGLANETSCGEFSATAMAAPLRVDADQSVRNLILMFGSERTWRSWGHLPYGIRTGNTASIDLYGMNGFDYFATHPEPAATFHRAMAEVSRATAQALTDVYDFSPHASIADIGGGNGELIAHVLTAAPRARGVLLDLPTALPTATARLAAAGLAGRCDIIAGDFFQSIPAGQDVYLLKNVLHDWDDAQCSRILRQLRTSMRDGSTALIIDRVLDDRTATTPWHRAMTLMDLNMMVTSGGRERTVGEFRELARGEGLDVIDEPLRLGCASPCSLMRLRPGNS